MTTQITKTNGAVLTSINDFTSDSTSSSIVLLGRGSVNFGSVYQGNLVKILENFAYPTAPKAPMVGQLWFKTLITNQDGTISTYNKLKIFTANYQISSDGWNQLLDSGDLITINGSISNLQSEIDALNTKVDSISNNTAYYPTTGGTLNGGIAANGDISTTGKFNSDGSITSESNISAGNTIYANNSNTIGSSAKDNSAFYIEKKLESTQVGGTIGYKKPDGTILEWKFNSDGSITDPNGNNFITGTGSFVLKTGDSMNGNLNMQGNTLLTDSLQSSQSGLITVKSNTNISGQLTVTGQMWNNTTPATGDYGYSTANTTFVQNSIVAGSGLGINKNSPGYTTLPGGFIIQAGAGVTGSGGYATINFPTEFPNICISATMVENSAVGTWTGNGSVGYPTVYGLLKDPSTTQLFVFGMQWDGANGGYWHPAEGISFKWTAIGY